MFLVLGLLVITRRLREDNRQFTYASIASGRNCRLDIYLL